MAAKMDKINIIPAVLAIAVIIDLAVAIEAREGGFSLIINSAAMVVTAASTMPGGPVPRLQRYTGR